ncbi:MAG: PIN domain-containing protein [Pseudomonadota bacterium]
MIFLDTHVFVWLYAGLSEKFSAKAIDLLNNHDLKISPMVMLETQYLYEIKRIQIPARQIYEDLHLRLGVTVANDDFSMITQNALNFSWTRNPFDRLIVAHAMALSALLLTADNAILENYAGSVWS